MNSKELEDWLTRLVAAVTGIPVVNISRDAKFSSLGLDSVSRVGLAGQIERKIQRQLDAEVMYTHNTIASLVEALAG